MIDKVRRGSPTGKLAPPRPINVLAVEDIEDDCLLVLRQLKRDGFEPSWERVQSAAAMKAALERRAWDIVLCDYNMPGFSADSALTLCRELSEDLPFIVVSGAIAEEEAVRLMRAGVQDYLMKDKLARLGQAVRRELREAKVREEHRRASEKVEHLNQVLLAVRKISQLMVRERDPRRMIQATCDCLTETRGYDAAWVALCDASGELVDLSGSGFGIAWTAISERVRSGTLPVCAAQALKRPGPLLVEEHSEDCPTCPVQHGLGPHRTMVIRLQHTGRVFGVIAVNLFREMEVDDEELGLFTEFASDLAFALHSIESDQERSRWERRQGIFARLLGFLNRDGSYREILEEVLGEIKAYTEVDAAGIRLRQGEDYPYHVQQGFSEAFIGQENQLVCMADGEAKRDDGGRPLLECTCGLVLSGHTPADSPLFSPGGSFWSNDTVPLLKLSPEEDPRLDPRNRCIHSGYRSVALVPLRSGEDIIGLLQLNDRCLGKFTRDLIDFLEEVGAAIGMAFARSQAARRLRESEQKFRFTTESSADAIFICDKQGTYTYVNQEASRLLGFADDELVGMNVRDLGHRDRAEEHMKLFQQLVAEGRLFAEGELVNKGGESIPVDLNAVVLPDGQIYASCRDISARKKLEVQVAQADRLASMGMLAAGVAHEINNPLAYVMYALESMGGTMRDLQEGRGEGQRRDATGARLSLELVEDLRERFDDALDGTYRIRDIVRGLSTFSRVEPDHPVPVELQPVVETALDMCFNEIKYRAQVVKELGQVPPVMASEGRLSQVFLNLLVNAAHSIDEGNARENEVRIRTWCEGDMVCAEVRDSGKGIEPEAMKRLFEPFFTTKDVGIGSGLGLPISRGILEDYGGTITVESQPGVGSSFVIRLPALAEEPVRGEAPASPGPPDVIQAVSGRILLVDDEAQVRAAVARILAPHEVVEAASGEVALELLEHDRAFDLILCDMMMPRVSGMDVHAWLVEHDVALARQLVFITGGAFTSRAREYLREVDNLRLEKPFDTLNFKKLVAELVSSARGRKS